MLKIAILDDYARFALQAADWSVLDGRAEITAFDRHLTEDEAAHLLAAQAGVSRQQRTRFLCAIRTARVRPRATPNGARGAAR